MRFPVLALLLLLTGCSGFHTPDWARSDSSGSGEGYVAAPADDLSSCREQARAMIQRDQAIDQDINNQDTNTDLQQGVGDLNRNLSVYNTKQRYERIVEDCMRARGYDAQNPNVKPVQVEQQGTPAAPAAAPEAAPNVTPAPSSNINPALPTYP